MKYFFNLIYFKSQQQNQQHLKFILVLIFLSIITLIIVLIYDPLQNENKLLNKRLKELNKKRIYFEQWLETLDLNIRKLPEFDQFILSEVNLGRLGNQMFRFASLYAIGQLLNRTPIYDNNESKMLIIDNELKETFPNFHSRIYYLKKDFNDTFKQNFSKTCCEYVDPNILLEHNTKSKVLFLTGISNFLSIRYFDHLRPQIIKLFEFNKNIIDKCSYIREKMLSNDSSYKICVHTRVGDFKGNGETKIEEVDKAMEILTTFLKSYLIQNTTFSLLLFGTDLKFLQTIKINESISKIYYIMDANMTRGEEINFAIQSCDSFLSTATSSTYAFWMAYLMPEDRPIFYVPRVYPYDSKQMIRQRWISIEEMY
ncbi:hypothetical protein ACQ4LE_000195 [Meloidogyne hapla]